MSIIPSLRGTGTRRAVDKVDELRDENRRLLTIVAGSDDAFAILRQQCAEAEEKVVQLDADVFELTEERDQLATEVRELRAQLANATAVTVPPMERDTTDGADQATAPVPVLTLQQAFGTSPAHIPVWARDIEPVANEELPESHPDHVPNPPYDLPEGGWR